jgi:hypothetical protein
MELLRKTAPEEHATALAMIFCSLGIRVDI